MGAEEGTVESERALTVFDNLRNEHHEDLWLLTAELTLIVITPSNRAFDKLHVPFKDTECGSRGASILEIGILLQTWTMISAILVPE